MKQLIGQLIGQHLIINGENLTLVLRFETQIWESHVAVVNSAVLADQLIPRLPAGMSFPTSGQDVARLCELWGVEPGVPVEHVLGRVLTLVDQGLADGTHVIQAIRLDDGPYRKWKSVRKTEIIVDGVVGYVGYILDNHSGPGVSRSVFWQRLRTVKRKTIEIDRELFSEMLTLPETEWHGRMGSGRSRSFVYDGTEFPEMVGKHFPSIVRFLKAIGKDEMKSAVHGRLKAGWNLDDAVIEPVSVGPGRIYRLASRTTNKAYVGLTTTSLRMRWSYHVRNALRGAQGPLAAAIRQFGVEYFDLEVLEEVSEDNLLSAREVYWINKLKTLEPDGYNRLTGGQVGGSWGRRTEYEGRRFSSLKKAAATLAAERNVPEHIAATRIVKGLPIPARPRAVQRHPDAVRNSPFNDLWRIHKCLWNRVKNGKTAGPVDPIWLDFDRFKSDVLPVRTAGTRLFPRDLDRPLGPDNFCWTDRKAIIAATQGRKIVAGGHEYGTAADFAKATGIASSTILFRLGKGMSGDEILAAGKEGPTSRKAIIFEGQKFKSMYAAARFAAEKYGVAVERARDRIRRGVPFN